jgi:hypothetical protein
MQIELLNMWLKLIIVGRWSSHLLLMLVSYRCIGTTKCDKFISDIEVVSGITSLYLA